MTFNPYTWGTKSEKVNSNVINLQLKNSTGARVAVDNLPSSIHLDIPRTSDPETHFRSDNFFFVKPSTDGAMQYHVTYVDVVSSLITIVVRSFFLHFISAYIG